MNILTSSYTLDLAGVPTFTLTMYNELLKRGHEITVYSPLGGKLEKEMKVIKKLDRDEKFDVIIAQHTNCAVDLKKTFPNTPFIFYSHGLLPEIEQPPPFLADLYFAINEEVEENLKKNGVPPNKIKIIRDFVDTTRFKPTKVINKTLKNVLFISNYKKWKNYYRVNEACKALGLNLVCCGSPYGRNYNIEEAINEADLVISWGRGILEGMSCARAALSFDRFDGDGYIDQKSYFQARRNNFSGRVFKYGFDKHTLADEIQKYDYKDGELNRDLILRHHDSRAGVDHILSFTKKI